MDKRYSFETLISREDLAAKTAELGRRIMEKRNPNYTRNRPNS